MLENRRVLVTGVLNNFSIAYAIAKAVLHHGGEIALTHQSSERMRDRVTKLAERDFPGCPVLPLDVASEADCEALASQLGEHWDRVDGVVHSVAFAPREALTGAYHEVTTRDNFASTLDVSAYSLTALVRAVQPLLAADASVLTLTYLGAERAVPNYNVMGVAKAALEASVRYLAASMGPTGTRVNAISAGPIKTLAASGIAGINLMLDEVARQSALGRNVSQEEVGKVAAFLLSDLASGITGEVVHVDAGYSAMGGKPAAPATDA